MTTNDYLTADLGANRQSGGAEFMTGIARSYGGARGIPSGPRVPDLPDSVARATLEMQTRAFRDATAAPGRYPVIVFMIPLGGTGASDSFLLAERLAAHGNIVVSGAPPSGVAPGTSFEDYLDLIKQSAHRVTEAALQLPGVDSLRAFAVDPTGSTALVLEHERARFAGVVAFDEMPFGDRRRQVLQQSFPTLRAHVLYVPLGDPSPNAQLIALIPPTRIATLVIPGARHGLLSPWGAYFQAQMGNRVEGYETAVNRVLRFVRETQRR